MKSAVTLAFALTLSFGLSLVRGWSLVPAAVAADDAPTGKVAFTRLDGDDGKLFVVKADGTEMKAIVTTPKNNLYPVWSPDGKQLAFTGFESLQTAPDVYLINADGTSERRITDGNGFHVLPSWSPDGKQVLCSSRAGMSKGEVILRLLNLDGTLVRELMTEGEGFFNFWSPDGKQVGYTKFSAAGGEPSGTIYLMNADGTGREQFANSTGLNIVGPGGWSPDGKFLLSTRTDTTSKASSVWITEVSTKSENQVATSGLVMREPIMPTAVWSPDGKWIVTTLFENGKGRIHLVSRDGQTKKALTPEADFCFAPTWTK